MSDEGKSRIFDGPDHFQNSVVLYTHFKDSGLRLMFAYLRSKEQILQRELHGKAGPERALIQSRLEEVEAQLMFMAHNLRYERKKSEKVRGW